MKLNPARETMAKFVPPYLFSTARIDRDLVADFFMLFARTEYALKSVKLIIPQRNDRFSPDWDKFARSVGNELMASRDAQIREAVRYLEEAPPQKQVYKGGHFEWKDRKCIDGEVAVFVIRSIVTVRNNLFHGGKEIVGLMAERDQRLIQHALVVLAFSMTLNDEVRTAFCDIGPESEVA